MASRWSTRQPGRPGRPDAPASLRHLDEVVSWNRSVYGAVDGALKAATCTLLMGGDHCLAMGSISGRRGMHAPRPAASRDVARRIPTSTPRPPAPAATLHGMPVESLLGYGRPKPWSAGASDKAALKAGLLASIRHPQRSGRHGEARHPGQRGLQRTATCATSTEEAMRGDHEPRRWWTSMRKQRTCM